MNTLPLMTVLLLTLATAHPAGAQVDITAPTATDETAISLTDPVIDKIAYLQNSWADVKYGTAADGSKLAALDTLGKDAAQLVAENPARAEPKIWQAIILSTQAGIIKGMSALPKVKQAKMLLEDALRLDARALDGSAHTSLGSLYYQVPGWPIAFGDNKKAEQHLKAALAINPDGIDPNYFYGDYLLRQGRFADAIIVLEHAQKAPAREGRAAADEGRQREIAEAIADSRRGLASAKKSSFN